MCGKGPVTLDLTKRFKKMMEEEEKHDDSKVHEVKMSGVEYA